MGISFRLLAVLIMCTHYPERFNSVTLVLDVLFCFYFSLKYSLLVSNMRIYVGFFYYRLADCHSQGVL